MSKSKLTISETTLQEEQRAQSKDISLIDPKRYKPYKQNQLLDNIIRELPNYKQLDMFGNASSINKNRTTNFELIIENYKELEEKLSKALYSNGKANQSAGKLLDSLLISLSETGFKTSTATLPLKKYAEFTGKTDLKELRKRVTSDLQVLKRVKVISTPTKRTKNNSNDYVNTYLFGGTDGIFNGNIVFKFNEDFFKIFAEQRHFLYLPLEALQSNEKKNPHTYLLYKKIVSHKRINVGKPRENIIKVKELYNYVTTLPRYEEISETSRQIGKRIIAPFERDLDVIKEFKWHYNTQVPLTDFKDWINADIVITWNNEQPGTESIIAGQKKQQKRVEKAKQRAIGKAEAEKIKAENEQMSF